MSSRPRRYRSDLNFAIERHLRAAGIEIPNPQRDLHIRSGLLKLEQVNSGERPMERDRISERSLIRPT